MALLIDFLNYSQLPFIVVTLFGDHTLSGGADGRRCDFAICLNPSKDTRPRRTERTVASPQGRASVPVADSYPLTD